MTPLRQWRSLHYCETAWIYLVWSFHSSLLFFDVEVASREHVWRGDVVG